jgi:hypothetical protein
LGSLFEYISTLYTKKWMKKRQWYPLVWWKIHEAAFPYLSALSKTVLSIPSSSGANNLSRMQILQRINGGFWKNIRWSKKLHLVVGASGQSTNFEIGQWTPSLIFASFGIKLLLPHVATSPSTYPKIARGFFHCQEKLKFKEIISKRAVTLAFLDLEMLPGFLRII